MTIEEKITRRINEANIFFTKNAPDKAIDILQRMLQENSEQGSAYKAAGNCLIEHKYFKVALPLLRKAVSLLPDDAKVYEMLAICCDELEIWTESIQAYEKVLELAGEKSDILFKLIERYKKLNEKEHALHYADKLLALEPENTTNQWEYAQLLKETDKQKEAYTYYNRIIQKKELNLPRKVWEQWFELCQINGDIEQGHLWLQELVIRFPDNALFKWLLGLSYDSQGKTDMAISSVLEAYEIDPLDEKITFSLSTLYRIKGDMEMSQKFLNKTLEINPLNTKALFSISSAFSFSYGDENFIKLNTAEAHIYNLSQKDQVRLHYALGKAYDDVEEFETAFVHYKVGGLLRSNGAHQKSYNNLRYILNQSKEKMDQDFFSNIEEEGEKSDKPVFIVGMPRSGTTLTEQILSGLDGVYGAGELMYGPYALNHLNINGYQIQISNATVFTKEKENISLRERGAYYIEQINKYAKENSRRVVDKLPHNFQWVGPLHLILPKASFIHMRRHPVETCLSAYRLPFVHGYHHWSDDLKTMGMYYRLYMELMAHWKNVLPKGTILDIRYEDVVNHPERESKRIAEHIGVEWTPECLAFHAKKRAVRTSSINQVRKPLYKDSMNRWQKYAPYLKPLLDEIGDLVEAYEAELKQDTHCSVL